MRTDGGLEDASSLFKGMLKSSIKPSLSTCNILLGSFKRPDEALSLYKTIVGAGISPDIQMLHTLVKCFGQFQRTHLTLGVIGLIQKLGYPLSVILLTMVMKGLCNEGRVARAIELFHGMESYKLVPDIYTFNTD
ncbi:hypothetical protein AMTR_s00007p00245600 [Amborella trichopoda]|uniref:Pentacotripeptide-repeat region of PRORP domain-containing protein n=1 Tax=Amborella trichopoda TaxID=13333 RepID=W1P6E3_AMBTC|nr:hypothetical protein AMTR_s00007p00245600 [Amborella trichopoda]